MDAVVEAAAVEPRQRPAHAATDTWLLEPMLDRAGFDVVERSVHRGAYAAYTCIRRRSTP
jgi:hypothetical protein